MVYNMNIAMRITPRILLAEYRYMSVSGIMEAINSPKYSGSVSFSVIIDLDSMSSMFFLRVKVVFQAYMGKHIPSIKHMFVIFEPITFPIAIPIFSPPPIDAKMETHNSGIEVEVAIRMKPTLVFPRLVISAILIDFVTAQSLALSSIISESKRIRMFPRIPHSSNIISHYSSNIVFLNYILMFLFSLLI